MVIETARLTKGEARSLEPTWWQGLQALATTIDLPDGRVLEMMHVSAGRTVFAVGFVGVPDSEVGRQFRESFVIR